ncbi:MAG: glycosyltransferase family 2 protein [Planctomycetota bacterium]|nr:MAG: glycosyltransferase family 2 protein [Planctomycetota bacterium]
MKLSIVIPVYNEVNTLEELLARVIAVDVGMPKQIIIVDDASVDGTREVYPKIQARWPNEDITIKLQATNRGKGAALREGFKLVDGDFVIIQDADLEYNPEDYNYLLKPILEDKADVVYGSRFRGGAAHRVDRFWHTLGNKIVTLFSNMLTDLNLTDMETCYKAFRREVIEGLEFKSNRFDFEPEFTAKIAKPNRHGKRWRVYEVGISYAGRGRDEGKKIRIWDGIPALWAMIRFRFFD